MTRKLPCSSALVIRSTSTATHLSHPQHKQQPSQVKPKQDSEKKTMAQLDEELRMKLEGRSGDGGMAGLELEGGKPVAMKRGVRENMFRLI